MKKSAVMVLCLTLVSVHAFAELVLLPGLGLSYYSGSTGKKLYVYASFRSRLRLFVPDGFGFYALHG